MEEGAFPFILDSSRKELQSFTLDMDKPAILFVGIIPVNGSYGSHDGVAYLFREHDTLLIQSNNQQQPVIRHVSCEKRNRELNMALGLLDFVKVTPFHSLRKSNGQLLKTLYSSGIPLNTRDNILDSLSRGFINSIGAYCKLNNVSNDIAELYRSHFMGMLYYSKLNAYNQRTYQYKESIMPFYKDSITAWITAFNCQNCANVPFYNMMADQLFKIHFKTLTPSAYLKIIAKVTEGNMRDFLLSKYILRMIENRAKDLDTLLRIYDILCTNPIYKADVLSNYKLTSAPLPDKQAASLLHHNQERITFNDLIARHKGKIIYIDFWASWCAPCLQQMPHSKDLKFKLKDEHVEVLYISTDTDFNSWVKTSHKLQLDNASSFVLVDARRNSLTQMLRLNSIPRYVIVDKSGKIIQKDASRPSDKETFSLLLTLSKRPL